MNVTSWFILLAAACLEVGGDACIRHGLRKSGIVMIVVGFLVLGAYGLVVNTVRWDFSRLLGVYVAVFALVSVLTGCILFKESIPVTTWLGLGLIMPGGVVIQSGFR